MPYVATGHPVGPRAEVLQHARRLANVNQRELGALAGIPRSHIRDFEAGRWMFTDTEFASLMLIMLEKLPNRELKRQLLVAVSSTLRKTSAISMKAETCP
jgi:hypothetical protein